MCGDVSKPESGTALYEGDRYLPVEWWLNDDRQLVAGLLPDSAVEAEVVDDRGVRVAAAVGDGAYAAVIDRLSHWSDPVVCCRNLAGRPVSRPIPDEYPRRQVTDAEDPCPACGALDYEECVPTENWRGGRPGPDGETIPSPIVVCRCCGQQETEGAISRFSVPVDEDEQAAAERVARWKAEHRVQRWYEHKIVLMAVTFPIYAAQGWPAQISGSTSEGDDLTGLTIAHTDDPDADLLDERPRLQITTSIETPRRGELMLAREQLQSWVAEEVDQPHTAELSDAAITLSFRALDRRRRAAAANAELSEVSIQVDGAHVPFTTLTSPGGRWVAVHRHGGLTITVAGHDVGATELDLEPIGDPAGTLLGPQPEET